MTNTLETTSFQKSEYSKFDIVDYCNIPIVAVVSICRSNDAYKESVASKIKEIKCSYGSNRAIELKDGVINYTVDFKSTNDFDFARDYLNPKL